MLGKRTTGGCSPEEDDIVTSSSEANRRYSDFSARTPITSGDQVSHVASLQKEKTKSVALEAGFKASCSHNMAPSTTGNMRHGRLSICFLAAAACGEVSTAFVYEHRLSPPRNISPSTRKPRRRRCCFPTAHKSSHSMPEDGTQDEEDEQNKAMLNELQDIKNGMGVNIPTTSELQGSASD